MVKVCHMTSVHNSQDVRILKKQCTSLAKNGYEVYLVAPGESYIENNVNIVGVGKPCRFRKRILSLNKLIYRKSLELDCEIYQIHDPELLPYALKLKTKGKKVIFDSHENYYLQIKEKKYINKYLRNIVSELYFKYESYCLNKINGVLFPSLLNGKNIFEGRCKNIEIIGNEPLLSELYSQFDYTINNNKNNNICYVGGLTYERGIDHIIKANYKLKTKLILGGKFSSKEFQKSVMNSKEFEKVDYRGICNRKEVKEIYEDSLIGICTLLNVGQYNKFDNFATKVYEYMSMGLPVIMSDYEYARKINEKYNFAILVDPENIDEISEAINYLINNKEEAIQMGLNGRKAIKEEFNWEIQEKKLLEFYKNIESE